MKYKPEGSMVFSQEEMRNAQICDELNYGVIHKPPNPEKHGKISKMAQMLEAIKDIGRKDDAD